MWGIWIIREDRYARVGDLSDSVPKPYQHIKLIFDSAVEADVVAKRMGGNLKAIGPCMRRRYPITVEV